MVFLKALPISIDFTLQKGHALEDVQLYFKTISHIEQMQQNSAEKRT